MDLRILQYFVAVAELEHVGRAAQRLHVSQSPLSRQIKQLEEQLGLELFIRERQRLRLTKSGQWLLEEAKGLLAHFHRLRAEAHQRSLGKSGSLSIAFTSAAMWTGTLPAALRRFQSEFPDVTVDLRHMRSSDTIESVRQGEVDVGFVSSRPSSAIGFATACVFAEPFVLAIGEEHSLAKKKRIAPSDLDGVDWIVLSDTLSQRRQKMFLQACAEAGFVPRVSRRVTEPMTLLALVESGLGVGFIRQSASRCVPSSVKLLPVPWLSFQAKIYMIRSAAMQQRLVEAFASYFPALA